jgi:hypothetical protein
MANSGLMFFCAICVDDFESHPTDMDRHTATAICPVCGASNSISYTTPENPTESTLTLENYNLINGLDNNTP